MKQLWGDKIRRVMRIIFNILMCNIITQYSHVLFNSLPKVLGVARLRDCLKIIKSHVVYMYIYIIINLYNYFMRYFLHEENWYLEH